MPPPSPSCARVPSHLSTRKQARAHACIAHAGTHTNLRSRSRPKPRGVDASYLEFEVRKKKKKELAWKKEKLQCLQLFVRLPQCTGVARARDGGAKACAAATTKARGWSRPELRRVAGGGVACAAAQVAHLQCCDCPHAFGSQVPQQNNSCDCGVFVLKYAERFMLEKLGLRVSKACDVL